MYSYFNNNNCKVIFFKLALCNYLFVNLQKARLLDQGYDPEESEDEDDEDDDDDEEEDDEEEEGKI